MQSGTKRKSVKAMMLESEGEEERSVIRPNSPSRSDLRGGVQVKNRTVLSDDEEENVIQRPRKSRVSLRTTNVQESDAGQEVKALMDVDDGKQTFSRKICAFYWTLF